MASNDSTGGGLDNAPPRRCARCRLWRNAIEFLQDVGDSPHAECLDCRTGTGAHQPGGARQSGRAQLPGPTQRPGPAQRPGPVQRPGGAQQLGGARQQTSTQQLSPVRPSQRIRCSRCGLRKRHWYFNQRTPSPGSANRSPQPGDICAECERKASSDESPSVGSLNEGIRVATEGRGSGARARESRVVEEEEEEVQEQQEQQEQQEEQQQEEDEEEEEDDDDDEKDEDEEGWKVYEDRHTCPGCGIYKPEYDFSDSSPRCSVCRRRDPKSDNGANRGAVSQDLLDFQQEEQIRLLEERKERERREEQGSQRRQEPESQRDPVQEQRRYQSRQIRSVEEGMERARRQEEGRQREPLQERPPSRSSRISSSEEGIEREIRYQPSDYPPSDWEPHPVKDPRPSFEEGLPERRTIYIRSSEKSLRETLATVDRNRALADEFRILLLGPISSPGREKFSQDHGAHIKLVSESEITDLDECLWCDETGMEQTAFGQVYFDRDRCRLRPGNGNRKLYNDFPKEDHRRWLGYCDWRGVAQIKYRYLPHHKTQPKEGAGEDDAEVGKDNDYLICDTCRTSAHSRLPLHWDDFPDVDSDEDQHPGAKWMTRRRDDREIKPQSWPRSRYSGWMHWIMHAWMPVCRRCDSEQKRLHTRGHDGCVCYQNWYLNHWLCQRCDAENFRQYVEVTREVTRNTNMRTHAIEGGALIPGMNPDEGGCRCPCGRIPILRDTETTMERRQMVKRCGNCLGFIIPKEFDPPPPISPPPGQPTSPPPGQPTSPPPRSPSSTPRPPPSKAAKSKRKPRVQKGERQPTRASKRLRGTQSPGSRLQMLNERGKTADQPIFV